MFDIEKTLLNIEILESVKDADGVEMVYINSRDILKTAESLKQNSFNVLISVTAVDYLEYFEAVYHFYSTSEKSKLIIKAKLNRQNPEIRSLYDLYSAADWHEREVFDLFGIKFLKHPNLKRILLPEDWIGYPLRKDYKMEDKRLIWNER